MADYINVTSLNRLAKQVLAQCDPLNDLIVCGEISGFTRHYKSGHLYFTLKDENASIKTVMFRSQAQLLNFEPQNGMLVLVYGRATIYERDGAFQLYADYMKPFGAGAAQMAFDALYKKLEAEGLFAPERKRPLPAVPRCIGVVTSKTGAAWQDVQNVIRRRWPMVKLLLAPVSVQGIEAERSITEGIRRLDRDPRPDLILVTRGGGSKEDLWVFNAERIAPAASRSSLLSAMRSTPRSLIMWPICAHRRPLPQQSCACPTRAMSGRKYSFYSKIFKKIYRIAANYAIIGLISLPLPSSCSASTSSLPAGGGSLPACRPLYSRPHSTVCRMHSAACSTRHQWRNR